MGIADQLREQLNRQLAVANERLNASHKYGVMLWCLPEHKRL